MNNKQGYCYYWDEVNGNLSSDTFAWLQYSHFKKIISDNPAIKKIIIWSDGCGYQNRNATISSAYLTLARETGRVLVQKYLVSGHTQMEVDSMHSSIEHQIRGPMYHPRDYHMAMHLARKRNPYTVEEVTYKDFKHGFRGISNIRPGKSTGDPKVHDLRALMYYPDGTIHYKLDFEDEWKDLPHRTDNKEVNLKQTFHARIPIKERKYKDLQEMSDVIPEYLHDFYKKLPKK